MGCDIHIVVEGKRNGVWFGVTELSGRSPDAYTRRNYALFGVLAGVRREDIKPIAQPRGVPKDASSTYRDLVADWADSEDAHSHSWLTLEELTSYSWNTLSVPFNGCEDFVKWVDVKLKPLLDSASYDDVRICFLFDN